MTINVIANDTGDWIHIDKDSWEGTRQDWNEVDFAMCQEVWNWLTILDLFPRTQDGNLMDWLTDESKSDIISEDPGINKLRITALIKDIKHHTRSTQNTQTKMAIEMLIHGLRELRKQLNRGV